MQKQVSVKKNDNNDLHFLHVILQQFTNLHLLQSEA